MIFLFPRWDMLIPWRVPSVIPGSSGSQNNKPRIVSPALHSQESAMSAGSGAKLTGPGFL